MHKSKLEVRKQEIILQFEAYRHGVRVMFLIHRNKEGGHTNNTKLEKLVSTNPEEWEKNLERLLALKDASPEPLRIYASVNPRNTNKAIRTFKENQLSNDYDSNPHNFYYDIRNRFISALMKPYNRQGTRFLYDLDTEEEYDTVVREVRRAGKVIYDMFPTKNGRHLITEAFNPALTPEGQKHLSKDGLLLLEW